jgi:Type I phosphodiesterase / nucleotide pyrophosphatase
VKRSGSLLLLALLSCAPAAPRPAATPPAAAQTGVSAPQTRLAATGTAQRVVLLSFDGLGADALARQAGLSSFERAAREGAQARVIPVTPTATIPGHVAMLTGAEPQQSGIVSNRFHLPGTPPEQETRAMSVDPDVESIIEIARRSGKRVGAVPFPTIDNRTQRRSTDFGMAWSEPVTRGRVITLRRGDFKREWVPPTWTPRPQRRRSFSPVMRARLEWGVPQQTRIDVDLVAYDLTDDREENYDAIYLESGDFEAAPDAQGWFPISMPVAGATHGSWSKILAADRALSEVSVYWGPINRNEAWPASFRALLDEEAGVWPGAPDEQLDPQSFTEQARRLSEYLTRAQTLAIQRMPFDLLLAYQPVIDQSSHPYLGRNDAVVRQAFVAADRALGAINALLDPARDAFLVTGDHGLMRIEREIRVNRLLGDAGLTPQWRAFTAGYVAHIYGTGDPEPVVSLLTTSGYFERVEKKTADSHRNSGDIVAYALPGNALSSSNDSPAVRGREGGGQHGALSTHRELHTMLFASGAGVPKGSFGEIAQTSIARFVLELLGL